MKRFAMAVMVVCLLATANIGLAMSQEQLDQARQHAQERINQAEEVTYDTLAANEKYYYGKTVKIKGVCYLYDDGYGFLNGGGDGKTIAVQIMTYRYKVDTEYTVVGRFGGMVDTVEGTKWAFILEETHLPFMSEYGL